MLSEMVASSHSYQQNMWVYQLGVTDIKAFYLFQTYMEYHSVYILFLLMNKVQYLSKSCYFLSELLTYTINNVGFFSSLLFKNA
jgi:hypothetical protein